MVNHKKASSHVSWPSYFKVNDGFYCDLFKLNDRAGRF